MQLKKFDFFFISPKDPFGKLFLKTVTMFESSSEAPFLRKIGKFKIGLNLKRSYRKTKGSLYFILTRFDTHFSKLLSSYNFIDLGFFCTSYTRSKKVSNVSSFVDTVNFTIFQKVIASRVNLYI